ncbi:hypothetical protein ASF43_09125 [Pseudorhodoferax sp. Leaf267]|nr:hypothetical protein ASF43_09125 [Pseudorhodoferax sp. Leaf267]
MLCALMLMAAVLWAADLPAVADRLRQARTPWMLASLACAVAGNLISAWRWRSIARWLGHEMPLGQAARVYFQAVALNALLPGAVVGGDVYRAAALRRRGLGMLEAGLSVLLDRLSGLWILAVLGLLAAAWGLVAAPGAAQALAAMGLPAVPFGVVAALALALLAAPALAILAARRAAAKAAPGSARWARVATVVRRPQWGREYGRQVLGSAVVQILSVAALACAALALGLDLPYWAWLVSAVPIFVMATLPISFGGWGTREAAAALTLSAFGVAPSAGVAVGILVGLLGLVQACAGAVLLVLDAAPRQDDASRGERGAPER